MDMKKVRLLGTNFLFKKQGVSMKRMRGIITAIGITVVFVAVSVSGVPVFPGEFPPLRAPGQAPDSPAPKPSAPSPLGSKPPGPFPPGPLRDPSPTVSGEPAGAGTAIDATNALLAIPWAGLSKQRELDAERSIRKSLEGKRIAHGGAEISLKGTSVAKWDFSLTMANVVANLNFAAPPGFRTASLSGFVMEAPLGRSWGVDVRGQIEGRASVKVGGEKIFSWSPSLFPIGLRISNMQIVADARFDPREPDRPRLVRATITPRLAVGGEGALPVSIPVSLRTVLAGGKLHLVGQLANLPVNLGPLDGRFTGNLLLTLEPRQYEVGAQVDLSTEVFGVPQGDDINISAAFQQATLTFQGKLNIRLNFDYLRVGYDKRVEVPLEMSFPFAIPSTDELNMLLVGLQPGLPRTYGETSAGIIPPLQTPVNFATPANEMERGIIQHLPSGTVLALDYAWLPLEPPVGRSQVSGLPLAKHQIPPPTYGVDADSAIWTGHYLAAESFRYAAMPSPAALERVKFVLNGIKRLFEVTGDAVGPPVRHGSLSGGLSGLGGPAFVPVTAGPGILSRTARRSDNPINYTGGPLETRPCYYLHPEGGWQVKGNPTIYPTYGAVPEATRRGLPQLIQPVGPIWYGWGCGTNHPVSRDQYVGVFMGLAMAYQNVNDPEVRVTAKKLIEDALDYLLRNNWNVVLPPDNRIVPTSSYFGDFPKQLAYLRIGKTVNPAKYGALYDKYAPAAELAWIPIWFSSVDPLFQY
jgi:hypothetical protein